MASAVAGPSRSHSFKGSGLAILRSHPGPSNTLVSTFTHLHFTFPLKLIHPRTSGRDAGLLLAKARRARCRAEGGAEAEAEVDAVTATTATDDAARTLKAIAVLYIVGYGGGLGSTKVFKMRAPPPSASSAAKGDDSRCSGNVNGSTSSAQESLLPLPITRQYTRLSIQPRSTLLLLPDPVTCYASSRYVQTQRFDMKCGQTSSLILLDWLTSGRQHLAHSSGDATSGNESEAWRFQSYRSRNEVRVEGQVVIRDVLLLEQDAEQCLPFPQANDSSTEAVTTTTELGRRTHPYSCYANLFLLGPDAQPLISQLNKEFQAIQQRLVPSTHRGGSFATSKRTIDGSGSGGGSGGGGGGDSSVASLIWSMSILNEEAAGGGVGSGGGGDLHQAVVRLAGKDTECVRTWLKQRLRPCEDLVGSDLYKQAIW